MPERHGGASASLIAAEFLLSLDLREIDDAEQRSRFTAVRAMHPDAAELLSVGRT